jgi:hypothetical protein
MSLFTHPTAFLGRRGMSLAFVLLFLVFLSFTIVPIIDMFTYSRITAIKTRNVLVALNLASETIEETKTIKFSEISGMGDNEWEPVEGEFFKDENITINYPESYSMYKRNVKIVPGDELPGKDPDLLKVIVTVKWEEMGESRSKMIPRDLKLVTLINRKERWE